MAYLEILSVMKFVGMVGALSCLAYFAVLYVWAAFGMLTIGRGPMLHFYRAAGAWRTVGSLLVFMLITWWAGSVLEPMLLAERAAGE